MTVSCEPRRAPPRRPESPFSSWCFVGIILVALVLRLPTSLGNCGKPPEYKSMQLNGTPKTSYLPGEKIFFECKPGYYYSNDYPLSTFCDQSNIWFLIDEACHRKKCPTPIVSNGETFDPQKGFEFAKEAHFYCNYGYYLKGEQILTCILSGDTVNWDHDIPTCEKILCKSPGKINNGKHTNNWRDVFEFNELVTYSCDHSKGAEEYSLVGESKLICSGPGKWSSDPPQCKVVQCEQPVIQHGRPLSEMKKIFSYLDEVLFECLKGFYLSGSNPVFCGGNSTWEPAVPTCIKDFKPPPPIKSSVSKFPGYSNLYEPSVEEIMEIEPGTIALIILTIYCKPAPPIKSPVSRFLGYLYLHELPSVEETVEIEPGTIALIILTIYACGAPPRFNSMKVKGNPATSYNTGDRVEYECRIGFRIIVPPLPTSTVCQADNTWTPPLQEACTAKSCPQLPEPINGHKIYANGTFVFGSQVHFFCDEGYYLLGTKILYCELDGKNVAWNDNPPRCEKVLCQPPKQIPNGMYTNSHKDVFEYNEVVTYSCNPSNGSDQYSLVGESRLVCSGPNKWSGDPPECKVIKCAYPVIKNGKLVSGIAKNFYYKSLITVGCLAGFHLKGNNTAVCGLNSTWEPKLPECIADVPTTVRTTPSTSRQPAITTTVKSSKQPAITTTVKSSKQPEVSFPSDESPTKEDGLDGKLFAVIVLIVLLGVAVVGTCVYKCLLIRRRE